MTRPTRRAILTGAASLLATPSILSANAALDAPQRNASSFVGRNWRDHFDTLGVATILCDVQSRAVFFWNADGTDHRIYPTSVPKTEDLTRRGYTEIVRKKVGPSWTPTASMRARDPSLPAFMPPGPGNPLGTHAMYLTWPAYLIHGTHDTRKIGRPSSSGCFGLYNDKIAELFAITPIGTQVHVF
ncbi:L,D-transpeptidase [Aestuariibius insulae]|uniref:L,D-transpeptidase n=1 Tax=Aestuariibius insulae TaxID=2058287 RepID=UPI00345E93F4